MAFNVLPGIGNEHHEMRLKSGRPFRLPGYFGRFANTPYQMALYALSCASLSMRLFFRRNIGIKTISPIFFLVTIVWVRVFFGEIDYYPTNVHGELLKPSFPTLQFIKSFEEIFTYSNFDKLLYDLLKLLWYLILQTILLIFFLYRAIALFAYSRLVDPFFEGFPFFVDFSWKLHFVYLWSITVIGLYLFIRKFCDRHNITWLDRISGPLNEDVNSRGFSVFFNWAGEKIGRNLDLLLIVLIAYAFYEAEAFLSAYFFMVGAAGLFLEDRIIGDHEYQQKKSFKRIEARKDTTKTFGDIVTF